MKEKIHMFAASTKGQRSCPPSRPLPFNLLSTGSFKNLGFQFWIHVFQPLLSNQIAAKNP